MITTSEGFMEAVSQLGRTDYIFGALQKQDGSTIYLSDDNIEAGSVSINRDCVTGEEIEFGTAIMAQLDFSLRTDESRYAFYDAVVFLIYGIRLPDDTWTEIPLGYFTVAEAERKNNVITMTAFDNLLYLDKPFGDTSIMGTPYELFTIICDNCDLSLATTEEEFAEMPNADQGIQIDNTSGCATWRDCAKVIAQMIGGTVVADRMGDIAIKRYGKEPCRGVAKNNRFQTTMADYVCNYTALRVVSSKGEFQSYDDTQESGLEMVVNDAPAWDYGTDETLQGRTDSLLQELAQIRYTPGDFSMIPDPSLECGDMLALETDNGTEYTVITGITWKYRGRMSVKSAGVNPYLTNRITRKSSVVRDLENQISTKGIVVLKYTNAANLSIRGLQELGVIHMNFAAVEDTTVMFMATIPVTADADGHLVLRYYYDAVRDDSSTVRQYIDRGSHIISVVNYIQMSKNSRTTLIVTAQTEAFESDNRQQQARILSLLDYVQNQSITVDSDGVPSLTISYAEQPPVVEAPGVSIEKNAIKAVIFAQGLATAGMWDGTIYIEETIGTMPIDQRMTLREFSDDVDIGQQVPEPRGISQGVSVFGISVGMRLANFVDYIEDGRIIQGQEIQPPEMDYDAENVHINEDGVGYLMVERYIPGEESDIDAGVMTSVAFRTDDKQEIYYEEVWVE